LGQQVPQFDLLYGLLNTDHGTLLMAGLGGWSVVIAQPQEPLFFHQQHWTGGCVIYQDIVLPGSRIYFYPMDCGPGLALNSQADWEERISPSTSGLSGSSQLAEEFGRLSAHDSSQLHGRVDLMLAGIQWREHFNVQVYVPDQSNLQEWINRLRILGQSLQDSVDSYTQTIELGRYKEILAFQSICDTVAIAHICHEARLFSERHGLDERRSYELDLVLSEALTNVMVHAYRGVQPEPILLAVIAFEQGFGVVLHDQGFSIPAAVLGGVHHEGHFVDDLSLDQLPEGGMGLKFIHMISHRFLYTARAGQEPSNRLLLLV
jgi:anti-sigma regulatory factor (Ser/Thr protein kinase)